MNGWALQAIIACLVVSLGAVGWSAAAPGRPDLRKLASRPPDIAPAAYRFGADRAAGENPPETEFLFGAIGHKRAGVLVGLLWEEPRPVRSVELHWPQGAGRVPKPEEIALRWFAFGRSASWWSRDGKAGALQTAGRPKVSPDGRTFVYSIDATTQAAALDNLVVAARKGAKASKALAVPVVRVLTTEAWKGVDVEIEWGFQPGTEKGTFDGRIEAYNGLVGELTPLAGTARRGITAHLL